MIGHGSQKLNIWRHERDIRHHPKSSRIMAGVILNAKELHAKTSPEGILGQVTRLPKQHSISIPRTSQNSIQATGCKSKPVYARTRTRTRMHMYTVCIYIYRSLSLSLSLPICTSHTTFNIAKIDEYKHTHKYGISIYIYSIHMHSPQMNIKSTRTFNFNGQLTLYFPI